MIILSQLSSSFTFYLMPLNNIFATLIQNKCFQQTLILAWHDIAFAESVVEHQPTNPYLKLAVNLHCSYSLLFTDRLLGVCDILCVHVFMFILFISSWSKWYKKLSCWRKTARCFLSLDILLSHSRSFEMTPFSKACVSPY